MCMGFSKSALRRAWAGGFFFFCIFIYLKGGKTNQHPQKAKLQNKTLTQNSTAEEMKPQEYFSH